MTGIQFAVAVKELDFAVDSQGFLLQLPDLLIENFVALDDGRVGLVGLHEVLIGHYSDQAEQNCAECEVDPFQSQAAGRTQLVGKHFRAHIEGMPGIAGLEITQGRIQIDLQSEVRDLMLVALAGEVCELAVRLILKICHNVLPGWRETLGGSREKLIEK